MKRVIKLVSLCLIVVVMLTLAGCGGGKTSPPVLKTIEIQPDAASLQPSGTREFLAVGKDQNGKAINISPTWTVTGGVGTVSPTTGANTTFTAGAAGGTGTVVATLGTISGSATVMVTQDPPVLTTVEITPPSVTVVNGATQEFTVTGKDQYGGDIGITETPGWSVDGGIGSVSPAEGNSTVFTAAAVGNGTITATVGGITGTALVTVSQEPAVLSRIELDSSTINVTEDGALTLTATGYDQNDQQIACNPTWSVTGGLGTFSPIVGTTTTFSATTAGTGTITATDGSISGTASLTVNEALRLTRITVIPGSATVIEGNAQQFTATGYDQNDDYFPISPVWSVTGGVGSVTNTGGTSTTFTATTAGAGSVVATVGTVSGSANVTVNSTTLQVPQDYATIQAAVEAAVDGTTIVVAADTYYENIVIENKDITLKSTAPNDPTVVANTVIDAGGNGSAVMISGSSMNTVTVEGFTITGGTGSDLISGSLHYGGGVYAYIASVNLRNNVITNNSAYNGGGGLYGFMCNLTLEGNNIQNNSSYLEGGGLYVNGYIGSMTVTLTNNIISNNSSDDRSGGGISTWNVGGTWSGNTIEGNTAATYAGGISLRASSPVVDNNQINDNTAQDSSGGIYVGADSQPVIRNNTVSGNQVLSINAYGGGIYIATPSLELTGNNITGNSSNNLGGGIYSGGDITLINNQLTNNVANFGGGIFVADSKTLTAAGSSFTRNQGYAIYFATDALWVDNGNNTFNENSPDNTYPVLW